MAAEVQRMREQLELLQAELLCNNARGRCLEDTDVISFCHIFLMLLVVNLKIGQRLQVCFHGHIFVKGHLFQGFWGHIVLPYKSIFSKKSMEDSQFY